MKVVILCGGLGSRLAEETDSRPKPMVEVGDRPFLIHIMELFARQGYENFTLALGYKGRQIKEYFLNFNAEKSDLSIDFSAGKTVYQDAGACKWRVDLIDTGLQTHTGGRIKRLKKYLNSEPFIVTYGDGIADIDIGNLLQFHRKHGKLATVTAVRPPARFGELEIRESGIVSAVEEKPQAKQGWINGGFFVFEPEVLELIQGDSTVLERAPLEDLAKKEQLVAYRHHGFWQCMDTLRDKRYLDRLWNEGSAPWRG